MRTKQLVVFVVVLAAALGAVLWRIVAPPAVPNVEPVSAKPAPQVVSPSSNGRSDAELAAGREKHAALRRALYDAELRRRVASSNLDLGPPPLDPGYAQARAEDLRPLFQRCYDEAIRTAPQLRGRFVVHLVVVGDPELGGIVEHAGLVRGRGPEATVVARSALDDCISSTVESLTFPPPDRAGRVELTQTYGAE